MKQYLKMAACVTSHNRTIAKLPQQLISHMSNKHGKSPQINHVGKQGYIKKIRGLSEKRLQTVSKDTGTETQRSITQL